MSLVYRLGVPDIPYLLGGENGSGIEEQRDGFFFPSTKPQTFSLSLLFSPISVLFLVVFVESFLPES